MKHDRRQIPVVVGAASLLVIFAALCLTVFALLTVSNADAERRLANISADAVCDYYAADSEAEQIFAQLRRGDIPDRVTVTGDRYSYICPISGKLSLYVELQYTDEQWTVLQWQAIASNR